MQGRWKLEATAGMRAIAGQLQLGQKWHKRKQQNSKQKPRRRHESKRDTRHWNKLRGQCGAKYAKSEGMGTKHTGFWMGQYTTQSRKLCRLDLGKVSSD